MTRLTLSLVLAIACLCLTGCSFVAGRRAPDGAITFVSTRIFTDAEIGKISAADGKGATFALDGVKTTAKLDALDLLNAAAKIAKP
jgi:hypothetical protein